MRYVMAMDATGLRALEEVFVRFQRQGTLLVLSGVQEQPMRVLERSGLLGRLGRNNVLGSFPEALRRVRKAREVTT